MALFICLAVATIGWLAACHIWPDPLVYSMTGLVPFAVYWAGIVWLPQGSRQSNPRTLALSLLLLGAGLGAMWTLIPPLWENDFYRYSWDGHALLSGVNPYRYAPDSPVMDAIRRPQDALVAFPWVPTCYPPVAQAYFALAELLAQTFGLSSLSVLRFLAWSLTSCVGLVLFQVCRLARLGPWRLWIWACSPLLCKELSNSAHYDGVCVFFVTAAFLARIQGRELRLGCLLGLAVNLKTYPLLLAPFFFRGIPTRRLWGALGLFGATVALTYLPFLAVGGRVLEGFLTFARYWEFNAPLLGLFKLLVGESSTSRGEQARHLAALVLALCLLWRWRQAGLRRVPEEPGALAQSLAGDCLFVLGSLYLLSPVLDPWYLCWIIPFLVLRPSTPWLVLTGLTSMSYLYYLQNSPAMGQYAIQSIPCLTVAALGLRGRRPIELEPPALPD